MSKDRLSTILHRVITEDMLLQAQSVELYYTAEYYTHLKSELRENLKQPMPVLWRGSELMPTRRRGPNTGKNQKAY